MCGITGFWERSPRPSGSAAVLSEEVGRMADTLLPRGPDDRGVWVDPAAGVALGFRRLAIVDLSVAGHQPMESASGRFRIVFNGEIYNHELLRKQLLAEAPDTLRFRGHSDTEVLLAAIEAWGLEAALQRSIGMFAIALWDRKDRVLQLARDRVGEKPLYYGSQAHRFFFGSELKAIRAQRGFCAPVDRSAMALYLRHGYVPCPHSIHRGVYKLPPGTIFTLHAGNSLAALPEPVAYWSAKNAALQGIRHPLEVDEQQALGQLDTLLRDAVRQQMMADVPLGAFLSGGIDSSLVVALMQAQSSRPVRTFSIGFHESGYNEAPHARAVAEHLGSDHTEMYVTARQAQQVIPQLAEIYDEPFADSSQIPTLLVAQLARQHVTVSLSGDGGDELFDGYTRYQVARKVWSCTRSLPLSLRRGISSAVRGLPAQWLDRGLGFLAGTANRHGAPALLSSKLRRVAQVLEKQDFPELYRDMVSYWKPADHVLLAAPEPAAALVDPNMWSGLDASRDGARFLDLVTYLPDDILVKVDRAAMAVSLETRVPLLDHRVVEFAWRLPYSLKRHRGQGKWLLRKLLHKYVPPALVERPKMGFGVPIGDWLRGPLRDWCENLLDERSLSEAAVFHPKVIRQRWREHLAGTHDWQHHLWIVLMFQGWLAQVQSSSASSAPSRPLARAA